MEAAASRAKKWGRDWYNAHVSFDQPRTPIVIDRVLPDPSVVRGLLIRGAPYWTVQRYVKNLSEMASLSDAGEARPKGSADVHRALVPGRLGL